MVDFIINKDETSIYLKMPSDTTIDLKGKKSIEVNTFGSEKVRVSVIYSCDRKWNKISSMANICWSTRQNNREK